MSKDISRRDFLKGAGAFAAGVLGAGSVRTSAAEASANAQDSELVERVTEEFPIPEVAAPEKTEYECDVLVIGGGFAGLNAAAAASDAGQSVVMIDKGRPGYSGLAREESRGQCFVNCMGRSLTIVDDMYGYAMTTYRATSTVQMNKKAQKVI